MRVDRKKRRKSLNVTNYRQFAAVKKHDIIANSQKLKCIYKSTKLQIIYMSTT